MQYHRTNPITAPINDPLSNPYIRKEVTVAGNGGNQHR